MAEKIDWDEVGNAWADYWRSPRRSQNIRLEFERFWEELGGRMRYFAEDDNGAVFRRTHYPEEPKRVIWSTLLRVKPCHVTFDFPVGTEFLYLEASKGDVVLWGLSDESAELEPSYIRTYIDLEEVPPGHDHLGSVCVDENLVVHVFRTKQKPDYLN